MVAAARRLLFVLVLALALVPAAAAATTATLERNVLVDLNALRAQHHLAPLRLSKQLNAAARAHSVQMAHDGYFAHESVAGSAFWKRIRGFYASSPWRFWSVGENLLWSSGTIDSHRAIAMWLASPEHKRNMLDPKWREIGISAVAAAGAPGVYNHTDVTIITTDFGTRR